jgi:AraC-like DNA-binding protein
MPSEKPATGQTRDWARFQPGAVPGMTVMQAHFTDHAFERHSHETYSIGYTLSGVQTFHCGGSLHASRRGDIILFNPDEPHDGQRGTQEGFGYAMLYVPQDVVDDCRDAGAGAPPGRYFNRVVVHDPAMAGVIARTVSATGQAKESLRAQELTRDMLVRLLGKYGESATRSGAASAGVRRMERLRDYLCAHYAEDVTVDMLAREAGLSRVHLTRAFTASFGVPPHIYLNAVRLRHAKEALLRGGQLSDVAAACGFADQSHFSRRFKGSVGLSPGAWLRQMTA